MTARGASATAGLVCQTTRAAIRGRLTGKRASTTLLLLALPPSALALWGVAGAVGRLTGTTPPVSSELHASAAQAPILDDVLGGSRPELIALGVLLAVWAGTRALLLLVGTRRSRAVVLTLATLGLAALGAPVVLLGQGQVESGLPHGMAALAALYWPVVALVAFLVLTLLFHLATPRRAPYWRETPGAVLVMLVVVVASVVTRAIVDLVDGSAPFVVLIWLYTAVLAVIVGAGLNAATRRLWPASTERTPASQIVQWTPENGERRGSVNDDILDRILAAEQQHLQRAGDATSLREGWRQAS